MRWRRLRIKVAVVLMPPCRQRALGGGPAPLLRGRKRLMAVPVVVVSVMCSGCVISDPLGQVAISTAGENTGAQAAGVSAGGGNAYGGIVAASNGGTATSGTLSVTNGAGCANGGLVAVSTNGCANGFANVTGSGDAGSPTCGSVSLTVSGTACGTYADASSYGVVTVGGQYVSVFTGSSPLISTNGQAADLAYEPPVQTQGAQGVGAKDYGVSLLEPSVALDLVGYATTPATAATVGPPSPTLTWPTPHAWPTYMWLQQPLDYQKTKYTCGPESTRLVFWYEKGVALDEAQLANEEKTDPQRGTVAGSIARVLNSHRGDYFFEVSVPRSPANYMSDVVNDVYYANTSLVANVLPSYLPYWSGLHSTGHYLVIYGYDERGGGYIYHADEFDPSKVYPNYRGPNPYGGWRVDLAHAFAAVHHSPSKSIIW